MKHCISTSFIFILFFTSCFSSKDSLLEEAINMAGDNSYETEKVINSFDGDKQEAAKSLIQSMIGRYSIIGDGIDSIEGQYRLLPNGKSWQFDSTQLTKIKNFDKLPKKKLFDLENIKSEYLIDNINDAWKYREAMIWNHNLSMDQFCELILPYRSGDERITVWRNAYRHKFNNVLQKLNKTHNSVAAAAIVSKAIGKMRFNQQIKIPHRTALDLLDVPVGYCRDDCDRTLYAMRAFGVPVTTDIILVSPDHGKSHMWNVVYDNNDNIYRMFDNYRYPPTRDSIHDDLRSKGKVYRITNSLNLDRIERYPAIDEIPDYLKDPRLQDVTSQYFGSNDAKIKINETSGNVYLGVFTPDEILPVDIASKAENNVSFRNIEPNIIFFPVTKIEQEFQPCGMPFMITSGNKIIQFIPNEHTRESITIDRKMPVTFNLKEKLASVIGTKIQIGVSEKGPWIEIDSIEKMPTHNYYRIQPPKNTDFKYIRISSSLKEKPEIGEIIVSSDSLGITKLPISYTNKKKKGKWQNLIDGNILSWYHYVAGKKGIILKIDSDKEVNSIFVVPRNDDNYVMPGEEYELFYFAEDGWKSLGRKVAEGFSLSYDVPQNAVLWLRNLTKGNEEQIFICRNGRQAFNADLRLNN